MERGELPAQMAQVAPYPVELHKAVEELRYQRQWRFRLTSNEYDRGQGCKGLTLLAYPDNPDSYHPEQHVGTVFLYPVPAAAFNRQSWEEWLWDRIAETEGHERAEAFRFETQLSEGECLRQHGSGCAGHEPEYRRPFKPAHADGWDPGMPRTVVSQSVVNTPNAGRLVQTPCAKCAHNHGGGMGEHFTIAWVGTCSENGCSCDWLVPG